MNLKDLKEFVPMKEVSLKELLSPKNKLVALVAIVLTAMFLIGAGIYFVHGHHAYGVTREHPWGLMIAMYIFFVGTSTGLCIIASFGHIFGMKEFDPVGEWH